MSGTGRERDEFKRRSKQGSKQVNRMKGDISTTETTLATVLAISSSWRLASGTGAGTTSAPNAPRRWKPCPVPC
jgi:hypothetical protein